MREKKQHKNLNRWSKYDVIVGNAHARDGARDWHGATGLRLLWLFIFNLQPPFRTPMDHFQITNIFHDKRSKQNH